MVKKIALIVLIVLALFLVACSTSDVETEGRSSDVTSSDETTTQDNEDITVKQSSDPKPTPQPTQQMDSEIQELLDAHTDFNSVEFIKDSGTYNTQEIFVKGNKYTKSVERPGRYSDPSENYDTVYIDRDAQTAYGYCADKDKNKCPLEYRGSAYELDFDEEDIVLPLDLYDRITYAEKAGSETIENRKMTIIEFTNSDGNRERMSIGQFYGFIFKQEIFDDNDEVIERHTFTNVAFNTLDIEDVSLPEGVDVE
ncbi:hypothetical protein ACFLZB_03185 [Nanoarchaeota archaeon]